MARYSSKELPKKPVLGRIKKGCRVRFGPCSYEWPDIPGVKSEDMIFVVVPSPTFLTLHSNVEGIGPLKIRERGMIDYVLPFSETRKDCQACSGLGSYFENGKQFVCRSCFKSIGEFLSGGLR